jgi:CheY-like chemotaxis protein
MANKGLHILVVDDFVDAAESMVSLLSCWGYRSEAQYGGPAALASAAMRPPAIILLDIGMPGMDGFEFALRLGELRGCKNAEIVAISGYTSEAHRARARAVGIGHYLLKPANPNQLHTLLDRLMPPAPVRTRKRCRSRNHNRTVALCAHVPEWATDESSEDARYNREVASCWF